VVIHLNQLFTFNCTTPLLLLQRGLLPTKPTKRLRLVGFGADCAAAPPYRALVTTVYAPTESRNYSTAQAMFPCWEMVTMDKNWRGGTIRTSMPIRY